jgi:hypothetical protein
MIFRKGSVVAAVFFVATLAAPPAFAQDGDNDGLDQPDDPCPADARNLCFGPVAIDQATSTPIRLNAGPKRSVECSGARIDCTGRPWATDFGFNQFPRTGACNLNGGGDNCVVAGVNTIFGCDDAATQDLFQCEHFDRSQAPELSYSFTVDNGDYLVNLYFANTFLNTEAVGDRVFDVSIEGSVVYDDFDQVAAAGASATAVIRSAIVTVSDGTLDIDFAHVVENPSIKGIEILQRTDCTLDAECIDADLCNGAETCTTQHCAEGTPVLCNTNEVCNPSTGNCVALGGACTTNGDCFSVELCNTNSGLCQPPGASCTNDNDCLVGEGCNISTGICQQLGGPCEDNTDCADSEVCNTSTDTCQAPNGACNGNNDCGLGQACNLDTNLCQDLDGPCTTSDDCLGGQACNTSTSLCQDLDGPCSTNADCAAPQTCNGVSCESPATTSTVPPSTTTTVPGSTTTSVPGGTTTTLPGGTTTTLPGGTTTTLPGGTTTTLPGGTTTTLPGGTTTTLPGGTTTTLPGGTTTTLPGGTTTTLPGGTTTTLPQACLPQCDAVCERCNNFSSECESLCGNPFQPDTSGTTAPDALFALRTATGLQTCALCLCDAFQDGEVKASDALAILRFATHLPVTLDCPAPPDTTTTTSTTTPGPTTTTTVGGTTTTVGGGTTTTVGGGTTTTVGGGTTTTVGGGTTTTVGGGTTTTVGGGTTTTVGGGTTTTVGGGTTTTVGGGTTTTVGGGTTTTVGGGTTTTVGGGTTTTVGGGTTTTTVGGGTTTTLGGGTTTTTVGGGTTTTTVGGGTTTTLVQCKLPFNPCTDDGECCSNLCLVNLCAP